MTRVGKTVVATLAALAALLMTPPGTAHAHGGSEPVVSLDGDPDLKKAVIEAVQRFLGTKAAPASFGILNGLVAANMDQENSLVVLVDHTDFGMEGEVRIAGLKDGSRALKSGPPRSEEECRKTADALLAQVPEKKRGELQMLAAPLLDGGLYFFTWRRVVSGIPVIGNEAFNVGINAHTAEPVFWELLIFDFPADMIETKPTISQERATRVALQAVLKESKSQKATSVTSKSAPKLVISGRQAKWAVPLMVEGRGAPVWALVDGKSGSAEVHWRGATAGELREIFGNLN